MRYGALVEALQSLRGPATIAEVRPSQAAVRYRRSERRGVPPLADIYVPPHMTGASVVLVHGGGFVIGSRRMKPMRYLAAHLSAAGIAVCAIDYRLIFRGGGLDPAVDDVCDALAFWSGEAARLGLDRRAISLVGLSAGASLGLLAAARTETALARLVCCFGLYEVDHLRGPAALLPYLLFGTSDRRAWFSRSPRFATQPAVPTVLLHGTADELVPVEQAYRLAAHRESLRLPTRLVIYDGAPHGFFNVPCAAADAASREIIEQVAA